MPSRLFWFLIGGAAATWWSTKHCDASKRRPAWRNGSADAPVWRSEDQKERMNAFGDTVTDMSEATLDTVISAVAGLKAKLAEHRAQREQQQQQQQQQQMAGPSGVESSGKTQPPHYV